MADFVATFGTENGIGTTAARWGIRKVAGKRRNRHCGHLKLWGIGGGKKDSGRMIGMSGFTSEPMKDELE
jgi:hypothetical protein